MTDILTQLAVGIISAVIGAMIPLFIQRSRGQERSDTAPQVAKARSGPGGVAIATTGPIEGDLRVEVDNRRKFVINNIQERYEQPQGSGSPGMSGDEAWAIGLLGLLVIGLFVTQFNVVLFFAVGVVVGLLVTATLGAQRAWRLRLWDRKKDAMILTEVVLAVAATVWAWITVLTSVHHGTTFETLRLRSEAEAALMPIESGGIARWVGAVFNPIIAFYKLAIAENHFFFVATLTVAVAFSFLLLAFAWLRLNDWYSYMGFWFDKGGERAGKRATRYVELTGGDVVTFVVGAAFVIVFASGLLLRVIEQGFNAFAMPVG